MFRFYYLKMRYIKFWQPLMSILKSLYNWICLIYPYACGNKPDSANPKNKLLIGRLTIAKRIQRHFKVEEIAGLVGEGAAHRVIERPGKTARLKAGVT